MKERENKVEMKFEKILIESSFKIINKEFHKLTKPYESSKKDEWKEAIPMYPIINLLKNLRQREKW